MKDFARKLTLFLALSGSWLLTATAVGALFCLFFLPSLPTIDNISDIQLKVPLRVYSSEGLLLAEYGDERREPVGVEELPGHLKNAILAAEDDEFYRHTGVDFSGIARAAVANLKSGGRSQGASTITMQVARNYFLTREKTYTRKLREVFMAFRLEQALDKDQILELYVNKIFLGHRAYGFAAASSVYYDKPLRDLTLAESAMLAGLPKAPSKNNPLSSPENALDRRNYVLERMRSLGMISDQEFAVASAEPVSATRYVAKVELDAPFIGEMVRQIMVEQFGEDAYGRGFNVYTTVKAGPQTEARNALREGLMAYDRRHGYRGRIGVADLTLPVDELATLVEQYPVSGDLVPAVILEAGDRSARALTAVSGEVEIPFDGIKWARRYKTADLIGDEIRSAGDVLEAGDIVYLRRTEQDWSLGQMPLISGALVALDPDTGAIVALAGGFDYYLSKFNRATQAQRQPGSNIKPFIYSAALEKGFTPATLISGAPIVIEQDDIGNIWRPENYSGKIVGPTPMRMALAKSLNLVSVRILRSIGPDFALEHIEKFGFDRDRLPRGLALALGAAQLTPLEVASGYAVFANGGYRIEPYLIDRIEKSDGSVVARANPTVVCDHCADQVDAGPAQDSPAQGRFADRAITPENAFIMNSMLGQVVKTGTARRALDLGRGDLGGKTGTTNNFRDAWFSGFNRALVATVWVGFDEVAELGRGEAGSRAALPIWVDFMKVALRDVPERSLPQPDSVVTRSVDPETGEVVAEDAAQGTTEFFIYGTEPDSVAISEILPVEAEPERNVQKATEGLF